MLTLCISTALPETSVALIGIDGVIGEVSWNERMSESRRVLPAIATLLSDNSFSPRDVTHVCVVSGPGSYTGLRIGVTLANTYAYACSAQIASIDTCAFLSARAPEADMIAIQVSNDAVFVGPVGCSIDALQRLSPDDAARALRGVIVGVASDQVRTGADTATRWLAEHDIRSAGTAFLSLVPSLSWDARSIVPLYMREPKITESKKR